MYNSWNLDQCKYVQRRSVLLYIYVRVGCLRQIRLIPLVVDTFGGWHKDSLEVITKLGRQVSRQTGKEEDEIVRQLRQRVAILLVRDNVNMFDSRTPSYPQAVIDADVDINV